MKRFFAVACSIAVGLIVADGGIADWGKSKNQAGAYQSAPLTVAQYWGKGKGKGKAPPPVVTKG
jgi:hypothetical protein